MLKLVCSCKACFVDGLVVKGRNLTLAIFHSLGKIREVIELLIIIIKGQEITGAANLSTLAEILSIPLAFDSNKQLRSL